MICFLGMTIASAGARFSICQGLGRKKTVEKGLGLSTCILGQMGGLHIAAKGPQLLIESRLILAASVKGTGGIAMSNGVGCASET